MQRAAAGHDGGAKRQARIGAQNGDRTVGREHGDDFKSIAVGKLAG